MSDGAVLRNANVAVIGVGGLGCPAALGLASSGIGRVTLIDPDVVEWSNLPRQILYSDADVGHAKVECAAANLQARFPEVEVLPRAEAVATENAARMLSDADFIIDATDGIATKLLINDVAVRSGSPFCYAGVVGFRGQLLTVDPGRSPCVRCLFADLADEDEGGVCSREGIVGPVAGLIGAIQASHAVDFLAGRHEFVGRLISYDGLADRWADMNVGSSRRCRLCLEKPQIPRTDQAGVRMRPG